MGNVIKKGQEARKNGASSDDVPDLAPLADFYRSYMKILERQAAEKEEKDMGLEIIEKMSVETSPTKVVVVSPSEIMGKTISASRSPNMAEEVARVLRRKGMSPTNKAKTYVPGRGIDPSKSL